MGTWALIDKWLFMMNTHRKMCTLEKNIDMENTSSVYQATR